MGKPNYRVLVSFDPQRGCFTARTPELEHLSGEGASRKDAIAKLEEELDAQLANMLSLGSTPPRAIDEAEYSGEVHAKVSKGLHRDLTYLARSEGVEVDQIVSELLASALALRNGSRNSGRPRAQQGGQPADDIGNRADSNPDGNRSDGNRSDGNRRGGFGRGHNPQIMDDRANFIEYVRGLDNNGGGQQRHGGGGGGQHNNGGGRNGRRRGGGGGQRGPQQGGGRDGNRQQHGQHGGGHQQRDRGQQPAQPQPASPPPPTTTPSE